jgi:hypothetical protein
VEVQGGGNTTKHRGGDTVEHRSGDEVPVDDVGRRESLEHGRVEGELRSKEKWQDCGQWSELTENGNRRR